MERCAPEASICAFKPRLDVPVSRRNELSQPDGVHLSPPTELHVSHALAGAFQKAARVCERGPVEEADVHVSTEGIDVCESGVLHAGSGMAVVQELANVRSAAAHALEPRLRHPSQFCVGFTKPHIDA